MKQEKTAISEAPATTPGEAKETKTSLTRRQMLQRIATTSAAVAATGGLGTWLIERPETKAAARAQLRDHRVALPAGSPQLVVARGANAADLVHQALSALGTMSIFVKRGERVVIKPNIGWNRLPEQAANTNPAVVGQLVREALAAGAATVWVADVPVNNAERCFSRSGIAAAATEAGAKLVMPAAANFREVTAEGRVVNDAEMLWPFVEADKVINVPVVKQHGLCRATMAMKNWYGVLGGHRGRLHQEIDQSIVDLATAMKPTLTVLDATRVLLANGPSGGSLDDVKKLDTVAMGTDEVALDAFGAQFLGREASEIAYLAKAEAAGLGRMDFRSLKIEEIGL
jgi:uncharacterized protein (DUF362 family)